MFRPAQLLPLLGLFACDPTPKGDVDTATTDDNNDDADGDGFSGDDDCDDDNAAVHPGATEVCDGIDNNCDEQIDEDVLDTWYADTDGDGYGDPDNVSLACSTPAEHVGSGTDCDDTDADVYPSAIERCDGVDNDCDGEIDEDATDALEWYADLDGDGFGDPDSVSTACDAPSDTVADDTDCDDQDADIHPDATEICDGVDNDCDALIDDADSDADMSTAGTWYADNDADGYGDLDEAVSSCEQPSGTVTDYTDCDDTEAAVNPAATEVCNSIDDDCDTLIDDLDPDVDVSAGGTWFTDSDTDGYGDAAAAVSACAQPSGTVTDDTDCDDTAIAVNPGATEVCNSIDDDCDTLIDDLDPDVDVSAGGTWYTDSDTDGYGDAAAAVSACAQPTGTVTDDTDCDDTAIAVNPGATEVCNSIDDDCDTLIDDDDSSLDLSTATTWYEDYDGDGYGETASTATSCLVPSGYDADDGDCDDTSTAYHPGATPGCDGEDYDCDGFVDNDADFDGYADDACGGDDCDDTDATIMPDSTGDCALGLTCDDILDMGRSSGDGDYFIDPDGYGTGLDPFTVFCDMTTDGGGWTEIPYAADLDFQQWFTAGDMWMYAASDFTFHLSDAQIAAVQFLSVEGEQEYVGRCEHVIHYYYTGGTTYGYAFGFMFFDGTETPYGQSSYSPYDVTVTADGCATNGGEGGSTSSTTDFLILSPLVPVLNVQCRDCGNTFPEQYGSELTQHPAWLR
jgi:large repetitive protein